MPKRRRVGYSARATSSVRVGQCGLLRWLGVVLVGWVPPLDADESSGEEAMVEESLRWVKVAEGWSSGEEGTAVAGGASI